MAIAPAPVAAETLEMTALYPARISGLGDVKVLGIEPFAGDYGDMLAMAAEQALAAVEIDGEPFFRINGYGPAADALLSGSAYVSVEEQPSEAHRTRCIKRDAKGKCSERAKIIVPCIKRFVALDGGYRLTRADDGRVLHVLRMRSDPAVHEICEDDDNDSMPPVASVARKMAEQLARTLRYDIAPEQRRESLRVMEDRGGMDKPAAKAFVAAIAATKRSAGAACDQWAELADAGVRHRSLGYNLALCAEQAGALSAALAQYRALAAVTSRDSTVDRAVRRVEAKIRATDEWTGRSGSKTDTAFAVPAEPTR